MYIKRGRIIFNEENIESDIRELKRAVIDFFENDERFSNYNYDIRVNNDIPYESSNHRWELTIEIENLDVEQELGGIYAGEKIPAIARLMYSTEGVRPQLVMNQDIPEFYYVYEFSYSGITNSQTWENNSEAETVEDIIENEILSKYVI